MNRLIALFRFQQLESLFIWNYQKIRRVLIYSISVLILGGLIFVFPPSQVIIIMALFFFLFFVVKKPEIGILAIFVIVASLLQKQVIPFIPVFGMPILVTDAILFVLLLRIPYKALTDRSFRFLRTPLDVPLLLFLSASIISVGISIIKYGQDFGLIVGTGWHMIMHYLLFFVITNLIQKKSQIRFLFSGLLGVATFVALIMIIQTRIGGLARLMYGRIESASQNTVATRLLPPGEIIIFIMFISVVCTITMMKKPLFNTAYFYLTPILASGVILTYNRQYWGAIIFALFVFVVVASSRAKKRFLNWLAIAIVAAILVIIPLSRLSNTVRAYTDSIAERFSTLLTVRDTWRSGSLEWRKIENQYAWRNIIRHPFLGNGLFNIYRPPLPGMDIGEGGWDSKRFMHNGYLWILMNMGLIGFIPIIWFCIRFLIRGFSNWRKIRDPKEKTIMIGFIISGVALSLSILVEPRLMQWRGIMVIATMAGMNEVIIHRNENENQDTISSG